MMSYIDGRYAESPTHIARGDSPRCGASTGGRVYEGAPRRELCKRCSGTTRRRAKGTSDTQRGKLYRWERFAVYPRIDFQKMGPLTIRQCQAIVNQTCEAYSIAFPPRVVAGRDAARDAATGSVRKIKLPNWALDPYILLHELTHSILGIKGYGCEHHGPRFARLFIELVSWGLGHSKADLLRTARRHRVRVAAPDQVPQRAGRRRPHPLLVAETKRREASRQEYEAARDRLLTLQALRGAQAAEPPAGT